MREMSGFSIPFLPSNNLLQELHRSLLLLTHKKRASSKPPKALSNLMWVVLVPIDRIGTNQRPNQIGPTFEKTIDKAMWVVLVPIDRIGMNQRPNQIGPTFEKTIDKAMWAVLVPIDRIGMNQRPNQIRANFCEND